MNGFSNERFAAVFLALVARRFLIKGKRPLVQMGIDMLEKERLDWDGTHRDDD